MSRSFLTLAGAATIGGLLLVPAHAIAETVNLDCAVEVETLNLIEDTVRGGGSRGVWKIRLYHSPSAPLEVILSNANPYVIPGYYDHQPFTPNLNREDIAPTVSDDEIRFCTHRAGCGARIQFPGGDGWYSVSEAVLDRRRSTFRVSIEMFDRAMASQPLHVAHTYFGACAPETERQF